MIEKEQSIIKQQRLKELLCEMIDIYSPSGKEEEILDYLCQYLENHGIEFECQQVEDNRYNILVPAKNKAELVFVGHVDTVAAFDLANYESRQQGQRIFGVGSTDMKGGCAAMIEAFIAFRSISEKSFPAALALVVGEEEEGDGAKAFLKKHSFPWAVVAEPTRLVPCLQHYGYLEMKIKTKGRRKHASLAKPHHNAIVNMLKMLLKLTDHLDASGRDFVYNIREMHSVDAGFAVPDYCVASIDLHLSPKAVMKEVIANIEKIVFSELKKSNKPLSFPTADNGYKLSRKGLLPEMLKDVYRKLDIAWKPGAFRSHSDANLFWQAGTKPIVLGPGELTKAHTQNESILLEQVNTAAEIYLQILKALAEEKA